MPVHDEPVTADNEAILPPPREQEAASGLSIAQQRALLRMKSARLRIAQRRRCSPARLVPDAALCELALANSPSPRVIRETFARHEIRDESLSRVFAEILQNELQNI